MKNKIQIKIISFILLESFSLAQGALEKNPKEPEIASAIEGQSVLFDPRQDLSLSPYPYTVIGSDVWVRPMFPSDWPGLVPILANPEKMKYYGVGKALEEKRIQEVALTAANENLKFKNLSLELFEQEKKFYWTFFTHTGALGRIIVKCSKDDPGFLELEYCGQGGTTKAAELVLTLLKNKNFMATVHPENKGSINVLKKLGFTLDQNRVGVAKFGSIRDYYVRKKSLTETDM